MVYSKDVFLSSNPPQLVKLENFGRTMGRNNDEYHFLPPKICFGNPDADLQCRKKGDNRLNIENLRDINFVNTLSQEQMRGS